MTYIRAITNFFVRSLSCMVLRVWTLLRVFRRPENTGVVRSFKETKLVSSLSSPSVPEQRNIKSAVVESPALYSRLIRGLRDKDETIAILNRKLDFLVGEIKFKDLRIENLILQVGHFDGIGLQRTRPYVTGSMQPRIKTKMPLVNWD